MKAIVDDYALIGVSRDGSIPPASRDAFEYEPVASFELVALQQTALLPHVGSTSAETRNAMAKLIVDDLVCWFGGTRPLPPAATAPRLETPRKDRAHAACIRGA